MNDVNFYQEIKFLFETYLSPKRDKLQIRIKNLDTDSILLEKDMNYSKVFFDAELNIYKLNNEGKIIKVDKDNFEAIVMKQG